MQLSMYYAAGSAAEESHRKNDCPEMNMDDFEALYKVLADTDIMQHYPYVFDEKRVMAWIERK